MAAKGFLGSVDLTRLKVAFALWCTYLLVPSLAISAALSGQDCGSLKEELRLLREAQTQIHASLVANHETFASVMETYSDRVENVEAKHQSLVASTMRESAQSFRNRGLEAQKSVGALGSATSSLLEKAQVCARRPRERSSR